MQANVDTDLIIPQRAAGRPPARERARPPSASRHIRYRARRLARIRTSSSTSRRYRGARSCRRRELRLRLVAARWRCGRWSACGIRCVIAPSFGDIFYNNCFQNGMLPVRLPNEEVEQLADEMKASPGNARVTVDLENCTVVSPTGRVIPFKVDARRQHAMLNGLDDIGQTMSRKKEIEAWQAADQNARPWVWP